MAGVTTLEEANEYLENEYLVWWEREMTTEAANADDAHRQLEPSHSLAASLSHVETRQVRSDYTLRLDGKVYQIDRQAVVAGLRGATVRIEKRLDGTLAVRHGEGYLPVEECIVPDKPKTAVPVKPAPRSRSGRRGSDWDRSFGLKKGPKVWQAARESGNRREQGVE